MKGRFLDRLPWVAIYVRLSLVSYLIQKLHSVLMKYCKTKLLFIHVYDLYVYMKDIINQILASM